MKQRKVRITWRHLLLIVLAVIAVTLTVVFASYIKKSGPVPNTFIPADSVKPEIIEDFDGVEKKDVCFRVGNTGYSVYVRAKIVITWQKENGTVYFSDPVEGKPLGGGDNYSGNYVIDLNLFKDGTEGNSWVQGEDGFYYYVDADKALQSVPSNETTANLINSCKWVNVDLAPEGYTLNVQIIVQTVQAIGYTDGENSTPEIPAYQDAWGITEDFKLR